VADVAAAATEVHAHVVSQHWPIAAPTHLPVPVPSHDSLLLLYRVYVSCVHDLVILILLALAYTANLISEPTHTTLSKSPASLAVSK